MLEVVDLKLSFAPYGRWPILRSFTPTIANSLIECIEVHNNDKYDSYCYARADIYFTVGGDSGQPCQKGKPWYVWKKSRIIGKASNSQHSKRYRAAPSRCCTVSLIKLLSYPARLIWQELLFIVRFSGRSAVDAVLSEAFIYRLFTGCFNRFSS